MNKYGIIYKVENKENGKIYIGQTIKSLFTRKKEHQIASFNGSGLFFHQALRKYGASKFRWRIIDTAYNLEELNKKEIQLIKEYNTLEKGYNMEIGGK